MPQGFPDALIIGTGSSARSYKVAGVETRTPRWQVTRVPSQLGEFQRPRIVNLGRGAAGIVGSRRTVGQAREGVADVVNADTSFDGRYGAGPNVTTIDLSSGNSPSLAGTIGSTPVIGAAVLPPMLLDESPVGYWRLGEASGDALDSSGNGNDGTVTIGAGTRDATALDAGGDGSVDFSSSLVTIPSAAEIENIFDSGGSLFFIFNADSAGEANAGAIIESDQDPGPDVGWMLRFASFDGKLEFLMSFSGGFGRWETDDAVSFDTTITGAVVYDADSVSNNPTIHLHNGSTLSVLTVGDGLTEISTPVGTRESDDTGEIYLGDLEASTEAFDGQLDEITLYDSALPAATAEALIRAAVGNTGGGIGGGVASGASTAIWADGEDDNGDKVRFIYTIAGARIKVIDPDNDGVEETTETAGVEGGDEALWAGERWIARRGGVSDFVQHVTSPWDGTAGTTYADADYTAINIHAGPDALYRAFSNFSGNTALIKKSTSATAATVALDANWAPSSGETIGDPGVSVTRLSTLGERLLIGKRNGLNELDTDFTARVALEWMAPFVWEHNCNFILPLGQAGEHIVSFRRGLYLLPLNVAIGTEALPNNSTDKKGRYTTGNYDGNWIYAFIESPATDDTHIIKMRTRRTPGPGFFEHHPIATRTDKESLITYLWPGAVIGGVTFGPRLYFADGVDTLAYIRLGETQPDQDDANWRFQTGAWNIDWPLDDFESPGTLKLGYKVDQSYEGVTGTAGITWSVSPDGSSYTALDDDGTGSGTTAITADGFAQRFGNTDNSDAGRELSFRISGTGSSATAQQRAIGEPVVTILEEPEMVDQIGVSLQLEQGSFNDDDAPLQWQTVNAFAGQGPQSMIAHFEDTATPDTPFFGRVGAVSRIGNVDAADVPGVILVEMSIRALDFS